MCVGEFDTKENNHGSFNVEDFYHDGVLSCDELYAMMNSSIPTAAVPEVETTSDWHSGSYIPDGNLDSKQLGTGGSNTSNAATAPTIVTGVTKDTGSGSTTTSLGVGGMKIPASGGYPSNGSFYRLVTLNSAGAASIAVDVNTSSTATEANPGTSVPSAGNSSVENSQSHEAMGSPAAGTKARKPRGRKPKHVKEAEAVAAAAATCAAPPLPAETVNLSPKVTVAQTTNLRARYENQDGAAQKTTIHPKATLPSPSAASTQQQTTATPRAPPNSPYFPIQQANNGIGNQAAANMCRSQWSQPQMSLGQLASHDRHAILTSMRNQGMSVTGEKSHHHHYYPQQQQQSSLIIQSPPTSETNRVYPQQQLHQHRPFHSEQPPPASPYNRTTQSSLRANQLRAKDPLDQLFASRISAPSHRSTVQPKIIQENRRIYNLLTTPTTKGCPPSSLEHLKLSQERWMQYPNPSILDENLTTPPSTQQPDTSTPEVSHHLPTFYPPPPPPQVDPATLTIGGGENMNIRRWSNFVSTASHPHSHEYGSGYDRYINKIQQLNERLDRLANGNYELRRQAQYLAKVNRHLMNRLRTEIEGNLPLRSLMYQHRQSLAHNGDGVVASDGRRGSILPSYLEEELMCDRGTGFGRRRCMRYENSDEFLPISDTVLDDLSWQLEEIRGERYRNRAPYHRRSSGHGPLEREVRGQEYFGVEGKRKIDASGSSPLYANLRKRIRPDDCDEGKVNEEEKDLGDDDKNPRKLEKGSSNAASQPASQIAEEVDISRAKLGLPSPPRTNFTKSGSLNSVRSVATVSLVFLLNE